MVTDSQPYSGQVEIFGCQLDSLTFFCANFRVFFFSLKVIIHNRSILDTLCLIVRYIVYH